MHKTIQTDADDLRRHPGQGEQFRVFLSSNFAEFADLRSGLKDHLEQVHTFAKVINLDDGQADHRDPMTRSIENLQGVNLCVVLIGLEYGGTPSSSAERSYAHWESIIAIDELPDTETIVFRTAAAASSSDPQLQRWLSDMEARCTVGHLDGTDPSEDILAVVRTLSPRYEQWLVPPAESDETALLLPATRERRWRDDRVTGFDHHHVGLPEPNTTDQLKGLDLVAAQQWTQVALAFEIGESQVVGKHVKKILEDQPMNGEACYWAARFDFASDPPLQASSAELATRSANVFEHQKRHRPAGAAWLLAAKMWRSLGKLEPAEEAARNAISRIGGHSDSHLELCLLFATTDAGTREEAVDAGLHAYLRSARSLSRLDLALRTSEVPEANAVADLITARTTEYMSERISEMQTYRDAWISAHGAVPSGSSPRVSLSDRATPVELMDRAAITARQHLAWLRDQDEELLAGASNVDEALGKNPEDRRPAAESNRHRWNKAALLALALGTIVTAAAYLNSAEPSTTDPTTISAAILTLVVTISMVLAGILGRRRARSEFAQAVADQEARIFRARADLADACARQDDLIGLFEASHLRIAQYAPVVRAQLASTGDVVRIATATPQTEDEDEPAAISPHVCLRAADFTSTPVSSPYRLYRVTAEDRVTSLSIAQRWAAYSWEPGLHSGPPPPSRTALAPPLPPPAAAASIPPPRAPASVPPPPTPDGGR